MLGIIFVYGLLAAVIFSGLTRPAIGMIGFYVFICLDPAWNWRWSLEPGVAYQQYIFVASAIGFLLNERKFPKLPLASKIGLGAFVGFLIWCHICALGSISPNYSERFLSVYNKQVLSFLLTVILMDTPGKIRLLIVAASLAQAYNAYQINLDYFQSGGFSRWAYSNWGSYSLDNNGYSLVTLPLLAATLSFALCETKKWRRYFLLFIALLQIHQILLLFSRGAFLGMLMISAIIIALAPRTKANILLISLSLLGTSALSGPSVVKEFSSIFAKAEDRDESADSRLLLWKAGYRITADYPLTGVGPDAARVIVPLPQYYDGGLPRRGKALHNIFLDVSTGTGLPGLALYLLFLAVPIWYLLKTDMPNPKHAAIRLAILSGMAGYLVASNFSSGLRIESVNVLIIAGYATINLRVGQPKVRTKNIEAVYDPRLHVT